MMKFCLLFRFLISLRMHAVMQTPIINVINVPSEIKSVVDESPANRIVSEDWQLIIAAAECAS